MLRQASMESHQEWIACDRLEGHTQNCGQVRMSQLHTLRHSTQNLQAHDTALSQGQNPTVVMLA